MKLAALPAPHAGGKIQDIERLRGLAVLFILAAHFSLPATLFNRNGLDGTRLPFPLGVELFFVISGYVVTASFLSKHLSFTAFYTRRVFRLWPVLAVMVVLNIGYNELFHSTVPDKGPLHIPRSQMYGQIPSLFLGYATLRGVAFGFYTSPLWSLAIEEQFYLVAPLCLVMLAEVLGRRGGGADGQVGGGVSVPRVRLEAAGRWAVLGVAVLLVLVRFGMVFGPKVGAPWLATSMPEPLKYLAFYRFDFLAVGVLVYFVRGKLTLLHRLPIWVRQVMMAVCVLAPLVILYKVGEGQVDYTEFPAKSPWGTTVGWLTAEVLFGLAVALASADDGLLKCGATAERWGRWVAARFARWPAVRAVAAAVAYVGGVPGAVVDRVLLYFAARSYSIYVLHSGVLAFVWWLIYQGSPELFNGQRHQVLMYGGVQLCMGFAILLTLVEVVHQLVEKPGIKLGGLLAYRLTRERAVPADPASADARAA